MQIVLHEKCLGDKVNHILENTVEHQAAWEKTFLQVDAEAKKLS